MLNRKLLIFLFFLVLSGIFWLMMALNETYEKEIGVPIRLVNVPKNVVITSELSDTISITVRDKGYTLMTYVYGERIHTLTFNFDTYANKATGRGLIPVADVQKQMYKQLAAGSKITAIKPDKLEFYFNYGLSKRVPIRLEGSVSPASSYYLSQVKFSPETVTIYASKHLIDSIRYISTEELSITNIADTLSREVTLQSIRGVKTVPNKVRITFYPDILTEESIEVPIEPVNVPDGQVLRLFPSKVNVRFTVGAGLFRNIKPEQFKVVADFKELIGQPSDKCNLYLRAYPQVVKRARLETQQVDYLIEHR